MKKQEILTCKAKSMRREIHKSAHIAEERVRAMFEFTEFDPDRVHGFMTSQEAVEFLGLPYSSFREIAPTLPRHAITPARFG